MLVSLRTSAQNITIETHFLALRHIALVPLLETQPCRFKGEYFSIDRHVGDVQESVKIGRYRTVIMVAWQREKDNRMTATYRAGYA